MGIDSCKMVMVDGALSPVSCKVAMVDGALSPVSYGG